MTLQFVAEGNKWLNIASTANNLDDDVEWDVPWDVGRSRINVVDWDEAFRD